MYFDFSRLFHQSSKDHLGGGGVRIPSNSAEWPQSWKTTFYKGYGRMSLLQLPRPSGMDILLDRAIQERASSRVFDKNPPSLKQYADLMFYGCGIQKTRNGMSARAQPSAGARFPIETYLVVFKETPGLSMGVYHYNVKSHALDVLTQRPFSQEDMRGLVTYEWAHEAAAIIVLTGTFARTQEKYGERGYRYILLEAGHIGQNIYLAARGLGLGCCGLAGTHDAAVEKLLDIDGVGESVVYALAVGKSPENSG